MPKLDLEPFGFLKSPEAEKPNEKKSIDYLELAQQVIDVIHVKTLEDTQEILFYDTGRYKSNAENKIKQELLKINPHLKIHEINEIIAKIKQLTLTPRESFDNDEFKLCLENCIIDFRSGKTEEHGPEKLFRVQIPVTFDPSTQCPNFIKFLHTCLPLSDDYIMALEQMACPIIKNTPKLEAMFFHTGGGDNGKSTWFTIMNWIYGDENYSTVNFHDLAGRNRFAKARLENKLLNTFPDIDSDAIENLDAMKGLISGDPVDAEYKYQNAHTFVNRAKLFFSANELPDIKAKTFSNFKRLRLIKWTQQFLKKEVYQNEKRKLREKFPDMSEEEIKHETIGMGMHLMDKKFVSKILCDNTEKSGIFNLLLICARKIYERDGFFVERDIEELKEQWSENSTALESFCNDCLKVDVNGYVKKGLSELVYYNYCKKLRKVPLANNVFHPQLKGKIPGIVEGHKRVNGENTRVYKGVSWNSDNEIVRKYVSDTGDTGFSRNLSPENTKLGDFNDNS